MKKKLPFVLSFALAALVVIGQAGFAHGPDNDGGASNMMNGNGMGMMSMMGNGQMSEMMDAMNSPEGKKMIESCTNFMQSFEDDNKEK